MPVSCKQLLANRANAQKSTGPKTDQSKEIVGHNAVKHGIYSHFNLDRALQFLFPQNQARYLSAFVNDLFYGYSGNKSKTYSDLNDKRENAQRPKSARQKKNKPNSGNPFPSSQFTAGQQLRRKNPIEKRGEKIHKAKPNIVIFMGYKKLHCFQLASLPSLNSGCTPKQLQDKAMAEPQDFVRGSALLG